MRHKKLKLSAVLLLGLGLTGLQAQTTMYVQENIGTQTTYNLSNIQKMSFSSGNLTVTKTNNSTGVYALDDLRYLSFTDFSMSIEEPFSAHNQALNAYPNPANDLLKIDLTVIGRREGTLSILNFEGKTVLSRQISNKRVIPIDISHLPAGIYLCRYSNVTEIKTVKIIKQ